MSDFLLNMSPGTRKLVKSLGLPLPVPQQLTRAKGPRVERPLHDKTVVVSGTPDSELASFSAQPRYGSDLSRSISARLPLASGGFSGVVGWEAVSSTVSVLPCTGSVSGSSRLQPVNSGTASASMTRIFGSQLRLLCDGRGKI